MLLGFKGIATLVWIKVFIELVFNRSLFLPFKPRPSLRFSLWRRYPCRRSISFFLRQDFDNSFLMRIRSRSVYLRYLNSRHHFLSAFGRLGAHSLLLALVVCGTGEAPICFVSGV